MSLMVELESLLSYEETFWKQKSKHKWLKEGDGNTKIFHRIVNGRKRKNSITKLLIDGYELIEFEDKTSAISNLHKSLFSQEVVSQPRIDNLFEDCLPSDLALSLEGPFSKEEIKSIVFSMDKDKSSGPDGFSMLFYHTCWELIKDD